MIGDRITGILRVAGATLLALAALSTASIASASASGVWWRASSDSWPATLPASGEGQVVAFAENLGYARASGEALSVTDRLPAGVLPESVSFFASSYSHGLGELPSGFCAITGQEVTCSLSEPFLEVFPIEPYEDIEMRIHVKVEGASSGARNEVSIAGGGASPTSIARPLAIGDRPVTFGISDYELTPENADGSPDTQAGSHPFQLTSILTLNQRGDLAHPPALVKDLQFKLPPGLIGNPTPLPQCTTLQFSSITGAIPALANRCPEDTVVGVATITIEEPQFLTGGVTVPVPLFNLTPAVGEPARFGFLIIGVPVILDTSVRTGGDYGVTVTVKNISELASLIASRVTFWGVPGDPRHDSVRGWGCIQKGIYAEFGVAAPCALLGQEHPPPLLDLPTACTSGLQTSVEGDSWSRPGAFTAPFAGSGLPGMDGCNRLPFSASIGVVPDGEAGSTPTGLTVGVHVPQEEALNANGLTPSQVKDTTVVLPAGVTMNPAAADGLRACSDVAEPGRPEGEIGLHEDAAPACPEASKVGTVEITTPLLPNPLTGAAYLAAQTANPFGSLVALYVVAEDPVSGSLVKLAGEVKPDPVTGQLVSTFLNTPQLPFEDFRLHFFGGSRAPLSTPPLCGSYTTTASIAPWSGNQAVEPSSTFQITSGPDGSPCADPLPFVPELTAGSVNIQAGAFTPFTMTMSRQDGQQNLKAIQLKMPPGLLGTLSGVKLCREPQADQGTCGPESLIGETIVGVGVGDTPFSVRGGRVYITEGYGGAPYGLSIVNPAKAGPFDLGQVVVRAKIEVDPITAALTVTSDSTGPYAIPRILDGIPLQIKHVNVTITRPEGFTFNPTNCQPMKIGGSLTSDQDATSALSVPFQITNCATLGFKPAFSVSTNGKTSRQNGARLHVKLTYPRAPFGSQANIARVKVDLPKQLPSRLSTLQKACTDAVFAHNPAACPAESRVGIASATTPVLPVALTGPAYFVSHAGLKFPELVIVLSGYGTTVQLHGETFISKTGVTSSTFEAVPDVPVGTFELTLPQGKYSALAANTNLCAVKGGLRMPTFFTAQNGAIIKQSTPIAVTGCTKKAHKAKKAGKRHKQTTHRKKR
jgi:hypothetical protein